VDVASIDIDTLDEEALSRLPSGQQEAVKKLHTQVARAVMAIESLKDENRRLRRRVEELEKRPAVSDDETVLTLPGDPESLRDTLNHFIDAIDAYLEGESVSGDGAGDGVAAASGGE
jgi:GTP1/Obg family GTP-binding protein